MSSKRYIGSSIRSMDYSDEDEPITTYNGTSCFLARRFTQPSDWSTWICARSGGIDLEKSPEELGVFVEALGWKTLVAQPPDFNSTVVQESYDFCSKSERTSFSMVHGVQVDFFPKMIYAMFGMSPTVVNNEEFTTAISVPSLTHM